MKKITIILTILMLFAFIAGTTAMADNLGACRARILNLANACEIWANAHNNMYPTGQEFLSGEFAEYVRKIGGSDDDFYDPISWKGLIYEIRSDHKYFKIRSPNPEKYGLRELYFDTKWGMVAK
ncbi:MAG: hypothetical protein J7M18_05985 [Candidatus Eremiobacteraeota bacterium]|nr:hypothetical protein [Candidatus Eremiobacteraeota bacterium]